MVKLCVTGLRENVNTSESVVFDCTHSTRCQILHTKCTFQSNTETRSLRDLTNGIRTKGSRIQRGELVYDLDYGG